MLPEVGLWLEGMAYMVFLVLWQAIVPLLASLVMLQCRLFLALINHPDECGGLVTSGHSEFEPFDLTFMTLLVKKQSPSPEFNPHWEGM